MLLNLKCFTVVYSFVYVDTTDGICITPFGTAVSGGTETELFLLRLFCSLASVRSLKNQPE
jgi:hypothetical protein